MAATEPVRITGKRVRLARIASDSNGGQDREAAAAEFERLHARLIQLADLLYADRRFGLLVVFQGMDTSGKDSTIRNVFSGLSPAGVRAFSFRAPSTLERAHDFLWRAHQRAPEAGEIAVFNRSYYEDVLVVRVNQLAPKERWKKRYAHINAFEALLLDEGTRVVKFFLHISRDYQKQRLESRLARPDKHWKFDPNDLNVRAQWDEYEEAYEDALEKCSTPDAPWYVIPAEKRWWRDLVITRILVETLEGMDLRYPKPDFDASAIRID